MALLEINTRDMKDDSSGKAVPLGTGDVERKECGQRGD